VIRITREEWWATPIWYFYIPKTQIDPNLIEKECYKEQSNSKGRVKSNVHGWQSEDIIGVDKNRPLISNLLKEIALMTSPVLKDLGVPKELELTNAWININPKNSFNQVHIHTKSMLSGVYYVSANEHSGDIVFHNEAKLNMLYGMFTDANNKNTYSSVKYKPETGKIILFPSWIPHGVNINNSQEDRISIAFNLGV
jgi:uncharacterized protein (TIGR02466 family)